jgi:hypothetical protein
MSGEDPNCRREPSGRRRLTETASGLAITAVLALLGLAALAGVIALLAFMVVGMPITTAILAGVVLIGGLAAWRARRR